MADGTGTERELGDHLFGTFDAASGAQTRKGLLDVLRDGGLRIGASERIAASLLIAELIARRGVMRVSALRADLAPLVARSPQEREEFFRLFDAFAPSAVTAEDAVNEASRANLPRARSRQDGKKAWRRIAVIAGITAVIATSLLVWRVLTYEEATDETSSAPGLIDSGEPLPTPLVTLPEIAAPTRDVFESLTTIEEVARRYAGAPTLAELAAELARRSTIGWSASAYEQRLHELTGLPRRQPLALISVGGPNRVRSAEIWARLARALDRIERPGEELPFPRYIAAGEERAADSGGDGAFAAQAMAERLERSLPAGTSLPVEKAQTFAAARRLLGEDADAYTLERALAVSPHPGVRRNYSDASWVDPIAPPQAHTVPSWGPWLAFAAPLVLLGSWLLANLMRRKAYLRRRKPEFPPLHMDLLSDSIAHARSGEALFHRIGQRLQRRTARDTDRLDIASTIRATVADGGVMVKPVFARTRATPEYLVFIEKRGAADQDYERLRSMVMRLRDMLSLEIYSYQTEPSMLEPDTGGRAVPIERLAATYSDHRLLILGTGADFLDPVTNKPLPGPAKLAHWDRRALLTPAPLAEWAREEFQLARELALPIGRATPEGLLTLAELLRLDGAEDDDLLNPAGDGLARPLPTFLRVRPQRYLYGAAPDDHPLAQLLQDLRNYLDPASFDWLCALSVYPTVQWDLTLYLGVSLAETPGGDAKSNPLYREDRVSALTQLPWLREGLMPNWLRRGLIEAMPRERADEARTALRKLIEAASATGDAERDESIRMRIGQEAPKDRLSPEELFEDEVLLDFMARGRVEDFELPQQGVLDRFLPREWRQHFGWPELIGVVVALAYAETAFTLAPRATDGALTTGAWAPLLMLAAGIIIVAALLNVGATYVGLRRVLERVAPSGLALAWVVAASLLTTPQLALAFQGALAFLANWPLIVLVLGASALIVVPIARQLAKGAGVYGSPPRGGLGRRVGGVLLEAFIVFLVALITTTLADELVQSPDARLPCKIAVAVTGLVVFALGALTCRFAPERLPPSKTKKQIGAGANVIGGAAGIALALAPIIPAVLVAGRLEASHLVLPGATDLSGRPLARAVDAEMIATTPEGRYFVTGGVDGVIRVFNAADPSRALAGAVADGGTIVALTIRELDSGAVRIAAATYGGAVLFYTLRNGVLYADPEIEIRSVGSPPIIALSGNGGWAVAYEDAAGAYSVATNLGPVALPEMAPITALSAVGGGYYAVGDLSGDVQLVTASVAGVSVSEASFRAEPEQLAGIVGNWAPVGQECGRSAAIALRVEEGDLLVSVGANSWRERIMREDEGWLETERGGDAQFYRRSEGRLEFRDKNGAAGVFERCA